MRNGSSGPSSDGVPAAERVADARRRSHSLGLTIRAIRLGHPSFGCEPALLEALDELAGRTAWDLAIAERELAA
jgi:hypothetical protein